MLICLNVEMKIAGTGLMVRRLVRDEEIGGSNPPSPTLGLLAPHPESFMYYIYLIRSKIDGTIYTGYTNDLLKRFKEHNAGGNKSTKNKAPFELIYYEAYKAKADAKYRENNLKRFAQAYSQLRKRIKNNLLA